MPEAMQYIIEQDSKAAREVEAAFVEEYNQRRLTFERNWDYYNGDHELPLKLQKDGYDDNVIVNHVEALADRISAFLMGEGITFDSGGDGETDETDQEIIELWDDNRGGILLENIALGGAVEGHNAVRLMPTDDGTRIVRLKQSHFSAFWNPFDMQDVIWYRLQHSNGQVGKRIDYVKGKPEEDVFNHDAEGWTELVYTLKRPAMGPLTAQEQWTLTDSQPWPHDWAPIVDWQNLSDPNGYYGKDEVSAAIRLNDALNFILSNTQRIIKHYASPKTVIVGATAGDVIETVVGGLLVVPPENANVSNLEMQADGALAQWLTNVITSGLWESGGMLSPSNIKDMVGQLTNFGLQVLFANAIKRTQKKRTLYSEAYELITRYALELQGETAPETIAVIWPDVLPEDEVAEVEALTQEYDRQLISKQTYRTERGYDHDEEEDRQAEETQAGDVGAGILDLLGNNRPFNRGV